MTSRISHPTSGPILVIGAGAAGLIAAWRTAALGAPVVLLERNRKPGIKLLISGGGKCNITHDGSMEDLRRAFRPAEARFLRPAFHRCSNSTILELLAAEHVPTYTRADGRVFPVSNNADDVVTALLRHPVRAGAALRLNTRVMEILTAESGVTGVRTDAETIPAAGVVIATGGMSYPKTGTTGDGYRWARELGHSIVPPAPALAPIGVEPGLPADWRGVALREGVLALYAAGKKTHEWQGDILFTHEGVSGPAALELSGPAAAAEPGAELRFDFFPGEEFTALDERLRVLVEGNRGKMIATVLESILPNRIIPDLLQGIGVAAETRCAVLTREERRLITGLLKSWRIGRVGRISVERGEVTAGGVALAEVDPQTMRSRKVQGLYWCGEVLDIAGPVGGYNLQAAFSTGFVAGETAGRDWLLEFESPALRPES